MAGIARQGEAENQHRGFEKWLASGFVTGLAFLGRPEDAEEENVVQLLRIRGDQWLDHSVSLVSNRTRVALISAEHSYCSSTSPSALRP